MSQTVFVADRPTYVSATELIDLLGADAGAEAAARADRSRDVGNVVHFCRWRAVERMIVALQSDAPAGRLH